MSINQNKRKAGPSDECSKRCRQKVKTQFMRLKTILQTYHLKTNVEREASNSWTRFQLVAHVIAFIKILRVKLNLPCAPRNETISAEIELENIKSGDETKKKGSSKSNSSNSSEDDVNKSTTSNWKSCAAYRNRLNKSLKMLRQLLDEHSTLIAASRSASRAGLLDATADYIDQLIKGKVDCDNFGKCGKNTVNLNMGYPVAMNVLQNKTNLQNIVLKNQQLLRQYQESLNKYNLNDTKKRPATSSPVSYALSKNKLMNEIFPNAQVVPALKKRMTNSGQILSKSESEDELIIDEDKENEKVDVELIFDVENEDKENLFRPAMTSSPKVKMIGKVGGIWRPYL